MNSVGKVSGFICAGVLFLTAGSGVALGQEKDNAYRNMINKDTFVQQLTDNRQTDALYRNIMTTDTFEQALVDNRTTDAQYN